MYLYAERSKGLHAYREGDQEKAVDFYPQELSWFKDEQWKENFLFRSTSYLIGYWRKANAIHKWIIDNCAHGVDECQRVFVSHESVKALLRACKKVMANVSEAPNLLPTENGFFFGSVKYDDWYFEDIKATIRLLTKVVKLIKEDESWDIYYNASW